MSARVLSELAARPGPTKREVQRAIEKHWRERGFRDARRGRPRLAREEILELGSESAVHFYFEGFRRGQ